MEKTQLNKSVVILATNCFLEWLDFTIYLFLSTLIANVFFPSLNTNQSLFYVFAIFVAGYIARPMGGVCFGHIGDRFGRKLALNIALLCMFLSALIILVLPPALLGTSLATAALLLSRILQGFAVGGECISVLVMMHELVANKRKGFYIALISFFTSLPICISAGMIGLLHMAFSQQALYAWAWRLPFVFIAFTCLLQLALLLKVPETPSYLADKQQQRLIKQPLLYVLKTYPLEVFTMHILTGFESIVYFFYLIYMPVFLQQHLGMSQADSLFIVSISSLFYVGMAFMGGKLCDRLGYQRILYIFTVLLLILSYPLALWMTNGSSLLINIVMVSVLSIAVVSYYLFKLALLPSSCCNSGLGFAYNTGIVLWGSTVPLVANYFIHYFQSTLFPTIYAIIVGVITLFFVLLTLKWQGARKSILTT